MKTLLIAAALLLPLAAHAQESRMSRTDGNKLLSICTAKTGNLAQGCEAYIDGVADAIGVYQHEAAVPDSPTKLGETTCIPGATHGTDMRAKVVGYLQAHADTRNKFAGLLVVRALHEAYPCH